MGGFSIPAIARVALIVYLTRESRVTCIYGLCVHIIREVRARQVSRSSRSYYVDTCVCIEKREEKNALPCTHVYTNGRCLWCVLTSFDTRYA